MPGCDCFEIAWDRNIGDNEMELISRIVYKSKLEKTAFLYNFISYISLSSCLGKFGAGLMHLGGFADAIYILYDSRTHILIQFERII
jgi:hypothetical protein